MKSPKESVWTAVRNTFHKRCARFGKTLRRASLAAGKAARIWSLKMLRNAIWHADEWCHRQEVLLRDEAAVAEFKAEVDPVASRKRERAIKKLGGVSAGKSITGSSASPHSRTLGPHRLPRLKYLHGEFVRSEARQ